MQKTKVWRTDGRAVVAVAVEVSKKRGRDCWVEENERDFTLHITLREWMAVIGTNCCKEGHGSGTVLFFPLFWEMRGGSTEIVR